jgi:copper chaperone
MATANVTLTVDGMACEGCAKSVTRAIQLLDPTAQVAIDLEGKRVEIRAATRERDVYEAAITKAGYNILPMART